MIYLNTINQQGKETIDQIDRKDFATFKDFKRELNNRIFNYEKASHTFIVNFFIYLQK